MVNDMMLVKDDDGWYEQDLWSLMAKTKIAKDRCDNGYPRWLVMMDG